jgi:hypothetical protein
MDPTVHRCLNCGVRAPDAYCPACGQSTRDRLPTFAQFMREAMGRYVAYDGKFWKTLAALLFRPGFLTREYLAGRRRRYIGPARLFLVSSLVLFATLRLATESINFGEAQFDPPKEPKAGIEIPKGKVEIPKAKLDDSKGKAEVGPGEVVMLDDDLNLNVSELAGRMGLLRKPIARFNALPRAQKMEQVVAGTLRYGPYAMFVLLPAFAALLKLLYLGQRRRHPSRPRLYGEHLVFAAHNHAFLFAVGSLMGIAPSGWMTGTLATWAVVYLAWSTRSVYGGRWLGIAVRAVILAVAYAILFAFVTIGLLIAAVLLR